MPLADQFWGDRYGIVKDPSGHQWSIAHHVEDLRRNKSRADGTGILPVIDCDESATRMRVNSEVHRYE